MEEETRKHKGPGGRRRTAALLAVVLAAAILIGGTFAWQNFGDEALNQAKGEPGPAGGRLHDDFEVVGANFGHFEWQNNLTANKDVYVENYESAPEGRDIFVRLKLFEYMEIGSGATLEPTDTDYGAREAEPLIPGADRDDVSTWSPRVPIGYGYESDEFRGIWEWAMGGQKTYMPTFNKDNHSQETDIKGNAVDWNWLQPGETANETKPGESNAYSFEAGLHDYFVTNGTYDALEKYWDDTIEDHAVGTMPVTHTAKLTETGTVITMEEWKLAPYDSQPGNYWVMDSDGWCYWASPVKADTATGLLLNNITLIAEPDEEWYYGIYIKSEMATASDWTYESLGMGFFGDPYEMPSPDAEILLYIITGRQPAVVSLALNENAAIIDVNGTLNLYAEVYVQYTNDPSWEAVTWSIDPATSQFADGFFTPAAGDAGKFFVVTATSEKDPGIFDTCTIYVPEEGKTAIFGDDGNIYIDNFDNTYQLVNPDGTLGAPVSPIVPGKPGASTDRIVTIIGGEPYLPFGDGDHYYGKGSDGKLGTGDDELLFHDTGSGDMETSMTHASLVVNPGYAEMMPQGSVSLSSYVTLNGAVEDSSGVTWELIGGPYTFGTAVVDHYDGSATVNIGFYESDRIITIRVTYPGSPEISKMVYLYVPYNEPPPTG